MIAEGERVAVRRTTHRAEYPGVPPTGKVVTAQWLGIFRLSDGRILDSWDHCETQGLLRQLDVALTSG
jgi:predicted ester cyclase